MKKNVADDLLDAIAVQLDTILQQLAAGFDATPAQRLHLEGLTAAYLLTGMDAEVLLQFCRRRLPANGAAKFNEEKFNAVKLNEEGSALQFDLWQQRAPVYPTTAD